MCARRRSPFLCLAKERNQRKAPPSLRPLRCATGQTCVAELAGCAAELTSRCALRSDNRGESVYEARACCAARATPQAPRRRRSHRGFEVHTGHRCARPPRRGRCAPCVRGRAKRWPEWTSPPLCACRGAQGVGRAWAAQHAHASCSGSLPLSERSGQRAVSSAAPPQDRASQVARSAAEGHGKWGRLFFAYFLLAKQKKVGAPPGAHPGQQRFHPQPKNQSKTSLQPSPINHHQLPI